MSRAASGEIECVEVLVLFGLFLVGWKFVGLYIL